MIRVGEYIRTPYGDIGRITNIPKHCKYYDDGFSLEHKFVGCGKNVMKKMKSTPNIIDLVSVGDLMYIDICPDDCGGIVVPRIAETLAEGQEYFNKFKSGEYILKGIITKEKIMSNMYWVKE